MQFTNFHLKNYYVLTLKIDNYPSKLRLFNASNNQIERIIITSKNRYISNLRQLILESNHIRQFNSDTIILPQSLEIISLANNHLEILDARIFSHLKNLTELNLKNNQLKRILPELLLRLKIHLNNNPLDCQCTPKFYRAVCEKSTNSKQSTDENKNCMAPHFAPRENYADPSTYLRFSTFTLACPINAQPPPLIIWSTPFGKFISINSSNIDLISSTIDEPIYISLTSVAGPLTMRTRHTLHAFNTTHLSVTQARGALQHQFSCSGINMLGMYTHQLNFYIDTNAKRRALWQIMYTIVFGFLMSLSGGLLCIILNRTYYYSSDHMKTPPLYPTMAPNSASRTPPNLEPNQWLLSAAANITGTLEQVRDKLRLGVQQVSEHMGQTMGRASELLTCRVQQASGTLRQVAGSSAAYLLLFRRTSQQRFSLIYVHTLSSLRSSGSFMRAGINILGRRISNLRDYCGVTTGHLVSTKYLLKQRQRQRQQFSDMQDSTSSMVSIGLNDISTIIKDDESIMESISIINPQVHLPDGESISSSLLASTSGINQLDTANNSVLLALNNFNQDTVDTFHSNNLIPQGFMIGGIGTFHDRIYDLNDDVINEPERMIVYGEKRPVC